MTEEKLKELLKKVSPMSFEEGKQYIESRLQIVNTNEIYDDGVYNYDFSFDDDFNLVISFTSTYIDSEEEKTANYDAGYWHIHGERYTK